MTTDVGSFKSYQLSEGRTTPVSARVSPTDRIRGEIDALFDGSRELSEIIEDVARLGARLIIQTAVEAEVDGFAGVPSDRRRVRRLVVAPTGRSGAGLAVPRRLDVQDAPRRPRRTGAGRVGHYHRRCADLRRPRRRAGRSPPTPGVTSSTSS